MRVVECFVPVIDVINIYILHQICVYNFWEYSVWFCVTWYIYISIWVILTMLIVSLGGTEECVVVLFLWISNSGGRGKW